MKNVFIILGLAALLMALIYGLVSWIGEWAVLVLFGAIGLPFVFLLIWVMVQIVRGE